MKIVSVLILSLALLLSGCDILLAPFQLIGELIPLAIKYAPYALMFLEKPEEKEEKQPVTMANAENFQQEIQCLSQETSLQLSELPDDLNEQLGTKKNLQYVLAVHLDSMEKVQKIQNWILKNKNKYRISYVITAYNPSDPQHQQKLTQTLQSFPATFIADGPLDHFSQMTPQTVFLAEK